MKKKLALLLVLSMVLSMIPMNVFGAEATVTVPGGAASMSKDDAGVDYSAVISIPKSNFSLGTTYPTATGSALIILDGDAVWASSTVTNNLVETPGSDSTAVTMSWYTGTASSKGAILVEGIDDLLELEVYFTSTADNGDVKIKVEPLVNSRVSATTVVVGTHYSETWNISAGDKVEFADVAVLNDITIADNRRGGVLGSTITDIYLTLSLPTNYTWVKNAPTSDFNDHLSAAVVNYSGWGTQYLDVNVTGMIRRSGANAIAEVYLQNLSVAASDKAKAGTNVKVNVDYWTNSAHTTGYDTKDDITVAKFGEYALELTYADSKKTASYYELESGQYGEETAEFVLTELTPNAFPTSRNNSLQARFDMPEGVRLTKAVVTFEDIENDVTVIDDKTFNVGESTNEYGVKVNADSLVISPYVERFTYTNSLYALSVQMYVSVEPGYEAEFGNDVAVTLGGVALDNVKLVDANGKLITSKEFNIATVTDQIVLDVEEVEITLANAGQYAASEAVGDIIIEEAYEGALAQNTEVWVYVESTRVFDLAFVAGSVTAEGLTISRATKLNITDLPVGIRFEIMKESTKEPGKITISGGLITGLIYPGVDYKVVVSGNAVAASNEVVDYMENAGTGTTLATYVKNNPALFENSYNANLFKYAGGTYQPSVVAPEVTPATPAFTGVSLSTSTPVYMLSNGDPVTSPFVIPSDEPGKNVGYMSCSVFSELVGLTSVEWDPATGLATLTGVNKMTGQETVMVLENGKYTALVNGVEVGIYSGSAASVPVRNFNDRFYVPAKFAAEMFGLTVEWNTTTGIATFY